MSDNAKITDSIDNSPDFLKEKTYLSDEKRKILQEFWKKMQGVFYR